MKTLAFLSLLLLLLAPAGHSAHHRHCYSAGRPQAHANRLRLLPLRVLRTPAAAGQRRQVRTVASPQKQLTPNE